MTDVEANGCAARGYRYTRFKVVLAAAVVFDGEIDVGGSDFSIDFLPPAFRRQFYWLLPPAGQKAVFVQVAPSGWEVTEVGSSESIPDVVCSSCLPLRNDDAPVTIAINIGI